ncbi:MAG TPA: folate-binding protein [Candidatus Angelobacter sp.]
MTQTALYRRLASADARLGVYNGAETVAAFTDPMDELRALVSGGGVFELGWRAKIMVTGEDRVRWLNGMVTNNVKDLPVHRGNYNFLLSPQGRILADMYIYNCGDSLLLDTDRSQVEKVMKTLEHFIIMDDVELKESNLSAIGLCGPKAGQVLVAGGFDLSGLDALEVRHAQAAMNVVRGPEQRPHWYELWGDREQGAGYREEESQEQYQQQMAELWDRLVSAGAQPVGSNALELWRIVHGIPRYGQDIRERDLAQETEQNQALNFTKGCYIGQEIVERIRSRGQVHRKFTGFEFQDALPQLGKFEEEGRVMGEITSTAEIGGKKIGLGYVRRETGLPGAKFNVGGVEAIVTGPPFKISI